MYVSLFSEDARLMVDYNVVDACYGTSNHGAHVRDSITRLRQTELMSSISRSLLDTRRSYVPISHGRRGS